jgi:alkaline phosphatase D
MHNDWKASGRRASATRRRFLASAAALGAVLAYGRSPAQASGNSWRERREAYPQGVASGDPDHESVILWTRRPPISGVTTARLHVEVAQDPEFRRIVANASTTVSLDADWTCRVLAAGLRPGREYWYRFTDDHGWGSRSGRTVTAPAPNDTRTTSFAFVSCQDVTQGACNAYRRLIYEDERRPPAERLGFVLHLGDFIYEVVWYPEDRPQGMYSRRLRNLIRYPDGEKIRDFHVPTTLEGYRTAYRAYLLDPDLQDARARWPFICIWDNHEFSWRGFQSQQVFGSEVRPAQTRKVAANQAWFEYQPARVENAGASSRERFIAPSVTNATFTDVDELGLGLEPNNLAAINSLKINRTLRWGAHISLTLTDMHSFAANPPDADALTPGAYRWMTPQEAVEILDSGRAYNNGRPPATIRYDGNETPNSRRTAPPHSGLGREQKAWLLGELRASHATWKIWGHSLGTLVWRTDAQNIPRGPWPEWPGAGYGMLNGEAFLERAEIFDVVKNEGITGFAIIAGDKHSFWAGFASKTLPPEPYDPVGIEFIAGSISSPGLLEVAEHGIPADDPLRWLYLHDRADGTVAPAMNMTILHGVRSSLALRDTGDPVRARALSNPDVSPHLRFADLSGHGYGVVRARADHLETEFVCIPRPVERADREDGGPIAYRIVHRAPLWAPGAAPRLSG